MPNIDSRPRNYALEISSFRDRAGPSSDRRPEWASRAHRHHRAFCSFLLVGLRNTEELTHWESIYQGLDRMFIAASAHQLMKSFDTSDELLTRQLGEDETLWAAFEPDEFVSLYRAQPVLTLDFTGPYDFERLAPYFAGCLRHLGRVGHISVRLAESKASRLERAFQRGGGRSFPVAS